MYQQQITMPDWYWVRVWLERCISNWRRRVANRLISQANDWTLGYSCAKVLFRHVFLLDCFRCTHSIIICFWRGKKEQLLVSEPSEIFFSNCFFSNWVLCVPRWFAYLMLEHGDFLCKNMSQSNMAKRLWSGGIFNNLCTANLLLSVPVKEFFKIG